MRNQHGSLLCGGHGARAAHGLARAYSKSGAEFEKFRQSIMGGNPLTKRIFWFVAPALPTATESDWTPCSLPVTDTRSLPLTLSSIFLFSRRRFIRHVKELSVSECESAG